MSQDNNYAYLHGWYRIMMNEDFDPNYYLAA